MNTEPLPFWSFEQGLDEALLFHSASLQPCTGYVRTLLDVLQQQPFLPAYAVRLSLEEANIRDQLLELSGVEQTEVLLKILQVSNKLYASTWEDPNDSADASRICISFCQSPGLPWFAGKVLSNAVI